MSIEPIINEIRRERAQQDRQWGGPDHDDEHSPSDWMHFIEAQITKFRATDENARERLIKIGALAVAAIESLDRQTLEYSDGGQA
jgi:hypothetical protein